MRVLVTGGAGYIGSVVAEGLLKDGHDVVVYDNLYKGHRASVAPEAKFVEADLLDGEQLRRTLLDGQIEAVIHMAANSLVGESVTEPAKYYRNNVVAGLVLLVHRSRLWRAVETAHRRNRPDKSDQHLWRDQAGIRTRSPLVRKCLQHTLRELALLQRGGCDREVWRSARS
jgi:dTDP-D-glucose 4,6-dehydratase